MNTGKVILGIVAGVAVGAAIGILFAPKKGVDTRNTISKKTNNYKDDLKSKISEFVDGLTGKISNVKNEALELTDKAMTKYQRSKEEAKSLYEEARLDGMGKKKDILSTEA